jgi:hypothetical protein
MRKISKKARFVVAGSVALALVGGGVAYGYWSTTGSGSGTANTSAGNSNLSVQQGAIPANLAPSVAPASVPGTITNNAPNSAYVDQLTVTITGVDAAHAATCTAADYGLTTDGAALAKSSASQTIVLDVQQELASGGSVSFPSFKIGFANDASAAQNGCKGAVPQLSFSTN